MNYIKNFIKLSKNKELKDCLKNIALINAKEYLHLPIRLGDFAVAFVMYLGYWIPVYFLRNLFLETNRITNNKEFRPITFSHNMTPRLNMSPLFFNPNPIEYRDKVISDFHLKLLNNINFRKNLTYVQPTCLEHRENDFSQFQNQIFINFTTTYILISKKQINEELKSKNITNDDNLYLKQYYMTQYTQSEYPYKKELYQEIIDDLINI